MRHTKTAAVLLAVSVFLAACGGSTGSAASGAGVAASETSLLNTLGLTAEEAFAGMEITEDTYKSLKNSIALSKRGGYVFCYNAPVLIVVANRKNYGNNMADCACAIENMMVAANAIDPGSCWINQLKWLNEEPVISVDVCSKDFRGC